jgi:hypothetical protein
MDYGQVNENHGSLRLLGFAALIAITLWMGCAAVADLCPEIHGQNHFCPVSHLSLVPFLRIFTPVSHSPVLVAQRFLPRSEHQSVGTASSAPSVSRAPPGH